MTTSDNTAYVMFFNMALRSQWGSCHECPQRKITEKR